jgi:uncharacterized GH25 family protein
LKVEKQGELFVSKIQPSTFNLQRPIRSRLRTFSLSPLVLVLVAAPLQAHDFWIEPSSFRPQVPSEVRLALKVGQDFRGDPVPRDDRRIARFVLVGLQGEASIPGLPGTDPAGFARLERPGLYVVGYRSSRTPITLEPDKFEKYLLEEGLERVVKARSEKGETGKPGREVYSRCAKSLLLAGEAPASGFDRALGLTLELIPERKPAVGELPVRLLYQGKPLEGALVVAIRRDQPDLKITARSDRQGRVRLGLARAGVWLVKAVHMVPAPTETEADWESLWASLTFEIP